MSTHPFRSASLFFAGICMAALLFVPMVPSRANFVDDAESAIDSTNSLPFKFSEWKPILDTCTGDDMVMCADLVSKSQSAQDAGVPSWLPTMIDIYFDVKAKDYWGLAADAGQTVACAAAEILTGVDICGAIKTLVDAAETVGKGVQAAVQFLADLGSSIGDALQDLGCDFGFGGCDDGPAPPSQMQLAQVFLASKIPQGLSARQTSPDAWDNFYNSVVNMGAAQGIGVNELKAGLPGFKNAVYQQWDSWILSSVMPGVNAARANFTPNHANDYVGIGMSHVGEIDFTTGYPTFDSNFSPVYFPGHNACMNAMANANAQAVSIWLAEGRPPSSSGIPAPPNPNIACVAFDNQLKAALAVAIAPYVQANLNKICQWHGAPENVYICSKYAESKCQESVKLLGQDPGTCILYDPGPGKVPFICPPDDHVVQAYVTSPPKGCHPAKLKDAPPGGGPPSNNQY